MLGEEDPQSPLAQQIQEKLTQNTF
jgi:hypothetical protein